MRELTAMAERVALLLIERADTVAIAESSSGGLIAATLLATPGASRCILGGGVIYTAAARAGLLGLTSEGLAGLQPATEPYAALLARTARQRLGATWGLGESGAAGPTANRYGDPPGHSCVAVYGPHELRRTVTTGSPDRWANMQDFAMAALSLLHDGLHLA